MTDTVALYLFFALISFNVTLSGLIVVFSIADCLSTNEVLAHGGYEANSRMAWIMRTFRLDIGGKVLKLHWAVKLAVTVGIIWAVWTFVGINLIATMILAATAGAFGYAFMHNVDVRAAQKMRGQG